MNSGKKQCPKCGREIEEGYSFCPFDASPLGRKCPKCGKVWEAQFQFCPLDSAPLGGAAATETAPAVMAAPRPAPPPQAPPAPPPPVVMAKPAAPPPQTPPPPIGGFSFEEQFRKPTWKTMLLRPVSLIFILGTLAVLAAVVYLVRATAGTDLPLPKVSYQLLPNEGKSKGVPVAVKVNRLVVFLVDDPLESGGGAARAQQIVTQVEQSIARAKGTAAVRFAVETVGGRPVILEVSPSGPDNRTLATVTEEDVKLAGETEGTRVAARWAERLTDAVKVYVFGEAPTFSVGTAFGDSLAALFKAAVDSRGRVTTKSLDRAMDGLPPVRRLALESPPIVVR